MYLNYRSPFASIYKIAREGDGDPAPEPTNTDPKTPLTGKVFTQEQVNAMLAKDKDKAKRERDQLVQQMQSWAEQGLTTENLTSLQARIDELTNEGKSKETLAKEAQDKMARQHKQEIEKATGESKKWKSEYEKFRLASEIGSAAAAKKARNPKQIQSLLGPMSYFREELGEDKKPTGEYTPRIKMTERDKDGLEVLLDLTVTEAVERLSQTEEHMNLFDSGANGGLGSHNGGGSNHKKSGDISNLPMADYYAERKKRLSGKS